VGDHSEPRRIPALDAGYDPKWAKEGKHQFPAEHKGIWVEGAPGDGRWEPHDPGAFGLERDQSIPFLGPRLQRVHHPDEVRAAGHIQGRGSHR
jgi:hypothetical protein